MTKLTKELKENCPFISVVCYGSAEYVGIISNQDHLVTSMYNYSLIKTDQERARFLELGEIWWWESTRAIPINLFLKHEMAPFKYTVITLSSKDTQVVLGPVVSLSDLAERRAKRRMVQIPKKSN